MVVIKKLLSEDNQEKHLFIKEAKIFHGTNSEHIVKFKAACMELCAMMLKYTCICFSPSRLSVAQQLLLAVWTDFYNIFT